MTVTGQASCTSNGAGDTVWLGMEHPGSENHTGASAVPEQPELKAPVASRLASGMTASGSSGSSATSMTETSSLNEEEQRLVDEKEAVTLTI